MVWQYLAVSKSTLLLTRKKWGLEWTLGKEKQILLSCRF